MQTLLKLVVGIVGLNLILVGALGASRALTRPKRRAVVVRLRGSGGLGLAPAVAPRPLPSRMIGGALAVAMVLAGSLLIARDFHLIPARQIQAAANPGAGLGSLHDHPARSARRAPTSLSKAPLPPSAAQTAGSGSIPPASGGTQTQELASPAVVTAVPVSATVIRLAWADVGRSTRYRVQRSTGSPVRWVTIATTAAGVTTYRDEGLPPGTTYFYRVLATNDAGVSEPSDVASSTTITLPAAPDTFTVMAATSTEIDLSWSDVANETGFRIERSSDGATDWVAITTTGQGVTFYSDTQLAPGITYFYRVFATNAGGDSPASAVASATTNGIDSPTPVVTP